MRPHLFYIRLRSQRRFRRPVIVQDLDEAIHLVEDACEDGIFTVCLGETWWLFAGWSEAEAIDQAKQYVARTHPDQATVEELYARIRAGITPSLDPLFIDDAASHLGAHRGGETTLF